MATATSRKTGTTMPNTAPAATSKPSMPSTPSASGMKPSAKPRAGKGKNS